MSHAAAAPAPGAPPPHVLVAVAETILEQKHPEAASVVVRLAAGSPGLTSDDRARLHVLRAMLCQEAHDDLCTRKEINEALSLNRAAGPPFSAPGFKQVLEDARAVFPHMQPQPEWTGEISLREPPAQALVKAFDALYAVQEFEAAGVVLQFGARQGSPSSADLVQFALRRGILQIESFDEAPARRSFQEALNLDHTARLPEYAPPNTRGLLEELRAASPPPEAASAPVPVAKRPAAAGGLLSGPPPWTWVVMGGGAVLAGAGGACYLGARANYDRLVNRDPAIATPVQLQRTADAGRGLETTSFALLGFGAVVITSGAVLHFSGGALGFSASVQPGSGALSLGLTGALP